MALARTWPWDAPTFRHEWIQRAAEKAARFPGLHVDVRVPVLRRILRGHDGLLSIHVSGLPGQDPPIPMYIICSGSLSPATLVANLALTLTVLGSSPDELVKSFETQERTEGGGYLHAIACIPSSRVS